MNVSPATPIPWHGIAPKTATFCHRMNPGKLASISCPENIDSPLRKSWLSPSETLTLPQTTLTLLSGNAGFVPQKHISGRFVLIPPFQPPFKHRILTSVLLSPHSRHKLPLSVLCTPFQLPFKHKTRRFVLSYDDEGGNGGKGAHEGPRRRNTGLDLGVAA